MLGLSVRDESQMAHQSVLKVQIVMKWLIATTRACQTVLARCCDVQINPTSLPRPSLSLSLSLSPSPSLALLTPIR